MGDDLTPRFETPDLTENTSSVMLDSIYKELSRSSTEDRTVRTTTDEEGLLLPHLQLTD